MAPNISARSRGCGKIARAVDRERKLMDKKSFQGFRCKTGDAIIPLQEVWDTSPQKTVWRGGNIPDFTYTCKTCGKTYTYTQSDVELLFPLDKP